ncbi:MAG: hypothetical protein M1816_005816 [Peltula sp. TS41687]|nr:MAG: hypothetical protein M1816_005816 [Peltula sp. TS41687]
MPIENPNGPWSSENKPPYDLPNVGPEELEPDYFEQYAHSHVLPQEVREYWREVWREKRKELLENLVKARPDTPPISYWVQERGKRLKNEMRNKVKASITWRMGHRQRLEAKIEKEQKRKLKILERACQLREEAVECERRAVEADHNIEEWKREIEAIKGNEDILADLGSPEKSESGQFKAISSGGLVDAIKGAGKQLGHIINDVGSRLSKSGQPGRWQGFPQFKPTSLTLGSLVLKA